MQKTTENQTDTKTEV